MRTLRHRLAAGAAATTVLGLTVACGRNVPKEAPPSAAEHVAAVEAWRAKHEADYRREWVTISGLHPLESGSASAGSGPTNDIVLPPSTPATLGRFVLQGSQVRFEPAPGAKVLLDDQPVSTAIDLHDDRAPNGADELVVGDVRLVVHVSGVSRSIRVRDPNGPLATGFLGFTWFPIDLQYRVVGRFIRDSEPRRVKVLNTFGDVDEYTSEGVVEFSLLGQTLRLRPFTTRPKRFYFVFRDASSGEESYEAARFLYTDLLDDGTTVLDFNQAYNPPCAFNPYTTCPIPLRENNLPVKILAGEKAYPVKVPFPGAS
ncbi:MAG: DUF1684 domain-containing protein [Vicinamibacterales bacterium]